MAAGRGGFYTARVIHDARAYAGTRTVTALTVAGSDSSGGAGLQADLRAFDAMGVHGASVVTLVTAQGTRGVRDVYPLGPDEVCAQLDAVIADMNPRAVKSGALGTVTVLRALAMRLRAFPELPYVLDPVLWPTRGARLLEDSAVDTLLTELLPRACVITPNRAEAERLTGLSVRTSADVSLVCERLIALGARSVLFKGGHLEGPDCVDTWTDGVRTVFFKVPRLDLPPMHGLGCTLSAIVTALLARGDAVGTAVASAHGILQRALRHPRDVGEGLSLPDRIHRAVATPEDTTAFTG